MPWVMCGIDGCENEAVDGVSGVIYWCEEHRDEALEAYRDWKEDVP